MFLIAAPEFVGFARFQIGDMGEPFAIKADSLRAFHGLKFPGGALVCAFVCGSVRKCAPVRSIDSQTTSYYAPPLGMPCRILRNLVYQIDTAFGLIHLFTCQKAPCRATRTNVQDSIIDGNRSACRSKEGERDHARVKGCNHFILNICAHIWLERAHC